MRPALPLLLVVLSGVLPSCSGSPQPIAVSASDTCAFCRMAVSDKHLAAELVAPGEEPRIYDDIGCLANDLHRNAAPEGAMAFVADHRTGDWIAAADAIYTRAAELSTPMGSHIVAHMSPASREADPAAKSGVRLSSTDVFGAGGPPGATRGR